MASVNVSPRASEKRAGHRSVKKAASREEKWLSFV
jgi:hypothetical protein